jgi:hypothetical protein
MKVLSGHLSQETSFRVNDYPYGYSLRCSIRYWLEINNKGVRFWSQTTNPKKPGEVWNKPKCSTYYPFAVMIQKGEEAGMENGHISWEGLSPYDINSKGATFLETYRSGMTEEQVKDLTAIIKLVEIRARKKAEADKSNYDQSDMDALDKSMAAEAVRIV